MLLKTWIYAACLVAMIPAVNASAETAIIAVATNFIQPMREIKKDFEKRHPHKLILSFAASGKLYAQIKNGAPFDVFLSADQDKPMRLVNDALAVKETLTTYAIGELILWSETPNLFQNKSLTELLSSGANRKIALANPRLAPYGFAAFEIIKNLNLDRLIRSRLVMGENISHAYQYVRTGNAKIGFIAKSQLVMDSSSGVGSMMELPKSLYTPIKQDAILINHGKDNAAAKAFMLYLQRDETKALIEQMGYQPFAASG